MKGEWKGGITRRVFFCEKRVDWGGEIKEWDIVGRMCQWVAGIRVHAAAEDDDNPVKLKMRTSTAPCSFPY